MDPETIEGQDTTEEATPSFEEHSSQETSETTPTTEESPFNPVWDPIRQELGVSFEAIKPELAKIDKNFNEHVTKVNAQYEPWKQFDTEGVTPEQVQNAFQMLQNLNDNPEQAYEALGKFLQENGRLPETKAEVAEVAAEAEDNGDEFLTDEQKELKALKDQVAEFQRLLNGQQEQYQADQEASRQAEMIQEASTLLEQEISTFRQAHPEFSDEDFAEIQQRHYAYALQGPDKIKSFEDVGQEYGSLLARIRSAPRPNDSAPRLPGAGGAVPAGQTKDPSTFTREESQNALVALLTQNNSQ